MVTARRISIILYDSDPESLREADIQVSTIKAVAFPRDQLAQAIKEVPELKSAGAYVLFGPDPKNSQSTAYIGESENVAVRLTQHALNASKPEMQDKYDHWEDTIAIVSKDRSLSRGHGLYLESRLSEVAGKNFDWKHRAGKQPGPDAGALTKADKIAMEEVVEQAILLSGTLGLDLFRIAGSQKPSAGTSVTSPGPSQIFEFNGKEWAAQMQVVGASQFLVLKGAKFRIKEAPTLATSTKHLRANMVQEGVLIEEGGQYLLMQDYEFKSVSAAGGAVSAMTVNGRTAWKDQSGKSYANLEVANLPDLPQVSEDE